MPIASPEVYAEMLDRAKAGAFAYPAINVTSSQTLNAALRGFAEAESDGIIQVSTGGAEYLSGPTVKDMVTGSVALAEYAHEVAKKYPVNIALHTDHCPKNKLDGFVRPLLAISQGAGRQAARSRCSSRTCGTARPCRWTENLQIAEELLGRCRRRARSSSRSRSASSAARRTASSARSTRSSTPPPRTAWPPSRRSASARRAATWPPLTFGNVHGVYKPGNVKLRPEILKEIQDAVGAKYGKEKPFDLVFHGGSGSLLEEIREALDYGVVKMNIDTDTQYAFTRPVADHMFRNYDGVLKIDGEVGNKKAYDPRAWGKAAEAGMAAARRRGLRAPALGRHHAGQVATSHATAGARSGAGPSSASGASASADGLARRRR